MTILAPERRVHAFRWVILILCVGAGLTFYPLWAPLVLAAWLAVMIRPILARIAKATGGRDRAAGVIVLLLVMAIFVPLGLAVVSLTQAALDLGRGLAKTDSAKNAFIAVVSSGGSESDAGALDTLKSPAKIVALIQEHGLSAAHILGGAASTLAEAALGLFIFLYALYVFLVDGVSYWAWLERHAPIDISHTRQLGKAFVETGRGLLVGVGLTGLAQGVVATISYFALGVPRALVLGLITCLASLIPSVGTALVWVPVAIGLALADRTGSALIMTGVGVCIIGTIDNFLRPVFSRFGKLELSTFMLLTSIFGGLAIFGAWGLLLGPLFTRLAKEALVIARHDQLHSPTPVDVDLPTASDTPT